MKKILFIWIFCILCSFSVFSQSKKKWEKTQSLNSIEAYQDFIAKYPSGEYSDEAKKNLSNLKDLEEKKIKHRQNRPENYKKIVIGMSPKDVISILQFENYINPTRFGGIFIGIGMFPLNDVNIEGVTDGSYTGVIILSRYSFTFISGKCTEWQILETMNESENCFGSYDFSIGGSSLKGAWGLTDKTFVVGLTRPDGTVVSSKVITE